jgi:hypothetical protein
VDPCLFRTRARLLSTRLHSAQSGESRLAGLPGTEGGPREGGPTRLHLQVRLSTHLSRLNKTDHAQAQRTWDISLTTPCAPHALTASPCPHASVCRPRLSTTPRRSRRGSESPDGPLRFQSLYLDAKTREEKIESAIREKQEKELAEVSPYCGLSTGRGQGKGGQSHARRLSTGKG